MTLSWQSDLDAAAQAARTERKPLLIDFSLPG